MILKNNLEDKDGFKLMVMSKKTKNKFHGSIVT